jgi:sorbitol-specific phosphotransferase system component IIBC
VVSLIISVASKTGFGIFLAHHLVSLKSEKSEMLEIAYISVLLEDSLRIISET